MKIASPRLGLLVAALMLVGCNSSDGDSSTVNNNQDVADVSTTELTLTGLVTDDPVVNADVMFKVGDNEFLGSVPTGSIGDFQVTIASDDPNALVIGTAFDAANNVALTAVLDSFAGCLDLAQNNIVNDVKITNITTAQQVLAERLALDGSIDSFEEFSQLIAQVDASELLELSSAIKVVVENIDGTVLPVGVSDTLELARTIADGSSSFLNDLELLNPGTLQAAQDKLLTDGNATLKFASAQAPGVYVAADNAFIYAVFDNGSALAEFFDDSAIAGTPSWQITADGNLRVNYYGFGRDADDFTLMSDNGETLHMVTKYIASSGQAIGQIAATVAKFDFGPSFDASTLAGTFSDPRDEQNSLVLQQGGVGYQTTQTGQNAFTWAITDKGSLMINFDLNDLSVELFRIESDTGSDVLSVTRFDGQWPILAVGQFQ